MKVLHRLRMTRKTSVCESCFETVNKSELRELDGEFICKICYDITLDNIIDAEDAIITLNSTKYWGIL